MNRLSEADRWVAVLEFTAAHHPDGDCLGFRHPDVLDAMWPRMRRWVARLDVDGARLRWRDRLRRSQADRQERHAGELGGSPAALADLGRVVDRLADVVAALAPVGAPQPPTGPPKSTGATPPRPNGRYIPRGNTYDAPLGGVTRVPIGNTTTDTTQP